MPAPLPRSQVDRQQTWHAESVFDSPEAFDAEVTRLLAGLERMRTYQGRLGDGPDTFIQAMQDMDRIARRILKVQVYAAMSNAVDTTDQRGAAMSSLALSTAAQVGEAVAFIGPELLSIGQAKLRQWLAEDPRMGLYEQYIENLLRKQAHVRSAEVEELLGALSDPFGTVRSTAYMLANADFQFKPARDSQGQAIAFTQSTFDALMGAADREIRRTAWENYADRYLEFKNTLASNLAASIKQNVFHMKVRRFNSSLEATLFNENVPVEMFHNLLDIFKKNLPIWHKYWRIRRRVLGVSQLHPYDVWAPLNSHEVKVPFVKAVDWISEGLEPMGGDYVNIMRQGCLEDRWVDWSPNAGKRKGAFSTRAPEGSYPFIMMSYTDDVGSMSTLAHELGHSMHAYYAGRAQPTIYHHYPSIVAETASNFHQAMTRAHLFDANPDRHFQIALLEEAMSNFHRYFFIMPTLARFELETHRRIEQGRPLTADGMIDLMADLFSEGYGGEMTLDKPRVGITWATFTTHLYIDYYSFQYAIGISAAHAIARRILAGQAGAVEDCIEFLKAGSSRSPIDVYKLAGIDMTSSQPIEEAFAVLGEYVDRLDRLTAEK